MSTQERSGHAIVLGASIGGLLAARVLSESFEKVTIFDRDELPMSNLDRKGVPQSEHSHGLLARGRQVIEELFPGFTAAMVAEGGVAMDIQRDGVWINDGHRVPRVATGLNGLCVSRATIEAFVRRQVRDIAGVQILDRHEAVGLLTDSAGRTVTGARILPIGGEEQELHAELVVDATGRGNRGVTWLAAIGFDKPAEEHVDPGTVYMSRDYRRTPGDADFAAVIISPSPAQPYGGVALAADGDRWMVTLLGVGPGQAPPADPEGYLEFTRKLPGNELYELLSKAEPLNAPKKMRLPTSVRRRYEHVGRLPDGFIAFGDAICSFNPAYGQGMTVAAAEAIVLRDSLRAGRAGLPKRFFTAAAKVIDVPWDIAVGADLRYAHVTGPRTGKVNFLNGYVGKLHIAAAKHPMVGHAFLSVANLMAAPQRLFAPSVLWRVLWSGRKQPAAAAPIATGVAAPATAGATTPARELEPVA